MKIKTISSVFIFFFLLTNILRSSFCFSQVFMWVMDNEGNQIDGDVSYGGFEGSHEVLEYSSEVFLPLDPVDYTIAGMPRFLPVQITKLVNQGTPLLFSTMVNGQPLQQVMFKFLKAETDSADLTEFFQITLEDVKLSTLNTQLQLINNTNMLVELVEFVYDKITWLHVESGVEYSFSRDGSNNLGKNIETNSTENYIYAINYPNPFNASTTISIGIPPDLRTDNLEVSIYDITGRLVIKLTKSVCAGTQQNVVWDGTDNSGKTVSTGVYLYKIMFSNAVKIGYMIFMK